MDDVVRGFCERECAKVEFCIIAGAKMARGLVSWSIVGNENVTHWAMVARSFNDWRIRQGWDGCDYWWVYGLVEREVREGQIGNSGE